MCADMFFPSVASPFHSFVTEMYCRNGIVNSRDQGTGLRYDAGFAVHVLMS